LFSLLQNCLPWGRKHENYLEHLMGKLFGTDGIRGIANQHPMTAEMAMNVGRAIAYLSKREGHTPRIVIGKDTRLSGDMFESALIAGACSMGANAISVGVVPTPGVAFLAQNMRADAGIVISASHNPMQDNGIKIFKGDGFKLTDERENQIEEMIFANNMHKLHPAPKELGKISRMDDAPGRYVDFLKQTFPQDLNPEGMKIVLDCSNGATYRVAPATFTELGVEVVTLFDQPDGKNINLHCGSQHPEALAAEVIRQKADAGFAFDGDGDRMIAVDERGTVLTGDQALAICSVILKKEGKLANNLVVRTVMSNLGLSVAFQKLDIDSVFAGVGDRYVLEEMLAKGAIIGGEDSGHLIFLQYHTTGDGMITALQVLAAMRKEGKPLSELASVMNIFPQMLINLDVKIKPPIEFVPEIMAAIKQAEEALGDKGRVLVRYSGTQNMCRVMVEGPTKEETERHCRRIADVVEKILA
jgi:phosphoglucosamine mutase